ncbi:MAG: rhodanese-like domain-containing protein [Anaerolineales bacterium]
MSRKHPKTSHPASGSAGKRARKPSRRNLAWLWVGLGSLVVAGVGIRLLASQGAPLVAITPAQAYAKYQQGIFFLDVRTQAEWNQFHIAKATLIPLDQLSSRLGELPKGREIVVVCLSGLRSQNGAVILEKAGFKPVSYMQGGLEAWMAAGYPVQGKIP